MKDWISTEDSLPTDGQAVIYYYKLGGVCMGRYIDSARAGPTFHEPAGFLTHEATHWMPKPEDPPQ